MHRHCLAAWAAFGCAVLIASPAFAGSGNTIYLKQDSSLGAIGNTIYVDQSAATGSQVGGFTNVPDLSPTPEATYTLPANPLNFSAGLSNPALQLGGNNSAKIADTGTDDNIALYQKNNGSGSPASLNSAQITLSGVGSLGGVIQNGSANIANLTVSGLNSAGGIWQQGDHNDGTVTVNGGTTALLVQNGSNNTNSLNATGLTGSQINYVVNGSNLTASAAQVVTNGAAVTITQTSTFR